MIPRTIIVIVDDDGYHVLEGRSICDRLSWDEMLGQMAILTMPIGWTEKRTLFRMRSIEGLWKENSELKIKLRDIELEKTE